jgi:hypothetical protein
MTTQAERRQVLLEMMGWTADYPEKYPDACEVYYQRVEQAKLVFPDAPQPTPTSYEIHQQFAEGSDPDAVAKAFANAMKPKVEPHPAGSDGLAERQHYEIVLQLSRWLFHKGKRKAARFIRANYFKPGNPGEGLAR